VGFARGDFHGWQDNLVNIVEDEFYGFQSGFYQQAGRMEGLQLGWINITDSMNGVQLGLFNMTRSMEGLQIGIVNVIKEKDKLPVLPIVNWSFK
jgi:hypothetical protein